MLLSSFTLCGRHVCACECVRVCCALATDSTLYAASHRAFSPAQQLFFYAPLCLCVQCSSGGDGDDALISLIQWAAFYAIKWIASVVLRTTAHSVNRKYSIEKREWQILSCRIFPYCFSFFLLNFFFSPIFRVFTNIYRNENWHLSLPLVCTHALVFFFHLNVNNCLKLQIFHAFFFIYFFFCAIFVRALFQLEFNKCFHNTKWHMHVVHFIFFFIIHCRSPSFAADCSPHPPSIVTRLHLSAFVCLCVCAHTWCMHQCHQYRIEYVNTIFFFVSFRLREQRDYSRIYSFNLKSATKHPISDNRQRGS